MQEFYLRVARKFWTFVTDVTMAFWALMETLDALLGEINGTRVAELLIVLCVVILDIRF